MLVVCISASTLSVLAVRASALVINLSNFKFAVLINVSTSSVFISNESVLAVRVFNRDKAVSCLLKEFDCNSLRSISVFAVSVITVSIASV